MFVNYQLYLLSCNCHLNSSTQCQSSFCNRKYKLLYMYYVGFLVKLFNELCNMPNVLRKVCSVSYLKIVLS